MKIIFSKYYYEENYIIKYNKLTKIKSIELVLDNSIG